MHSWEKKREVDLHDTEVDVMRGAMSYWRDPSTIMSREEYREYLRKKEALERINKRF